MKTALSLLTLLALPILAQADVDIPMSLVTPQGMGAPIGHITLSNSPFGVVITPDLKGLPPGLHGFHLHSTPSCAPGVKDGQPAAALGAGGHFDPEHANHHGLPWDSHAHLGDLPPLFVDAEGAATQAVLAPRFKNLEEFRHHALIVHEGGDNHRDTPPLGGGGARLACGVLDWE